MKKKVNTRDIFALNKRYITEINVHENEPNDFRGIMDNIPLFIERALRHGNCISLNDVDYSISESTFWDIEFFEEYCLNLYFCFKKGFTVKLVRKIKQLNRTDTEYFHQTLSSNFTPYPDVLDKSANSYRSFIGMKLQNLNRDRLLDEVRRLDKENRRYLLNALKEALENKTVHQDVETETRDENYDNLPFTKMLNPIEHSKFKTKGIIQDYLFGAGIAFELFHVKPAKKKRDGSNKDGFNGAVAAMIFVFKKLHYFDKDFSFDEILDAYLEETKNEIGKLSYYKAHYLDNGYFIKYKQELLENELKDYSEFH